MCINASYLIKAKGIIANRWNVNAHDSLICDLRILQALRGRVTVGLNVKVRRPEDGSADSLWLSSKLLYRVKCLRFLFQDSWRVDGDYPQPC